MLQDAIYIFKTKDEWLVLRKNVFSYKEAGKKGMSHCDYNSIKLLEFEKENKLTQLFIHIPALDKVFFLSTYYPGLEGFARNLKILKEKNSFLGRS
jgi:hypothetical protein